MIPIGMEIGGVPLRGPIGWRSFVSRVDDEGMLSNQLVELLVTLMNVRAD